MSDIPEATQETTDSIERELESFIEDDNVDKLASEREKIQESEKPNAEEMKAAAEKYSTILCDREVTNLLNYVMGQKVFEHEPGCENDCGYVTAKVGTRTWRFNYEMADSSYVHIIPPPLRDETDGPNDQVTRAIGQLIQMVSIHYSVKLTKYIQTHTDEESRALVPHFLEKPRLDGAANLWLSNTTDKVLGLVFTEL